MRAAVALLFFTLTGVFLVDPLAGAPPVEPTPAVDAADLTTAPPRTRMTDPPTVVIGGISQRCSDCHMLFASEPTTRDDLRQHDDLVHDHGMNDRCFNCHSSADRDMLVLHDGAEVGYDQVVELCAKCHGTVFRDWQSGTHGRTHGSWDPDAPEHRRLACTDCHDPHAPAFDAITPLPGPRTFRMGEVLPREPDHGNNPLRRHLTRKEGIWR